MIPAYLDVVDRALPLYQKQNGKLIRMDINIRKWAGDVIKPITGSME